MGLLDPPARDFVIAGGAVAIILLALALYTGSIQPVVVIESNSMMHIVSDDYRNRRGDTRAEGVPYGRFGTIDPGDLVLVKKVDRIADVELWVDGGRDRYGAPGDVVVYQPGGGDATPIIHRAMTFVWVRTTNDVTSYIVKWSDRWPVPNEAVCAPIGNANRTCTFTTQTGVLIDALGVRGMQPKHNGILTKGDNVATNVAADQVMFQTDNPETAWDENLRDRPVRESWLEGVARGEVPWFGLLKLSFTEGGRGVCYPVKNCEMGPHPYYIQIGNVVAPKDLFVMLAVGMVLVVIAPVTVDIAMAARHRTDRKRGTAWTLLEGTSGSKKKGREAVKPVPREPARDR